MHHVLRERDFLHVSAAAAPEMADAGRLLARERLTPDARCHIEGLVSVDCARCLARSAGLR